MRLVIKRFAHTTFTLATVFIASQQVLRADAIMFDPDGGGNSPKQTINSFQYGAGNALMQGMIPFTDNANFRLLYQGQLNSVVNSSALQVTPAGVNASGTVGGVAPYEITLVISASEQIIRTAPSLARFALATPQATNTFIEVYYDPNQNANALAGTGYNDGLVILKATPAPDRANAGSVAGSGSQPNPLPNFDSFGTNNYATAGPGGNNITSVVSAGSGKIEALVTYVDANFFIAPAGGDTGRQLKAGDSVSFDLGLSSPFDKIDPSHLFVAIKNSGTGNGPAPAATPDVGGVNGSSGPDLQVQAIAWSSTSPSPTPTPTPTATPTPTPGQLAITLSSPKTSVHEGKDAEIIFTANPATHPQVTVNYSTGGDANLGPDYTLTGTPGQVVIPMNAASASITLHSISDNKKEPNGETARIFVEPGSGYTFTPGEKVGVQILDGK